MSETNDLVSRVSFNTKVTEFNNEIPSVTDFVKKTDFDAEFTENDNTVSVVLNTLMNKTDFDQKVT